MSEKKKEENPGIGIIGVGGIANDGHLPAYKEAGLKVVAAADCSQKALDSARERWGIEKVFTDYHDMLNLPEVKIVDISTPPMVKLPQVLDAVKAGKHILVQKPLSRSFKEARTMVEAAEKAGVLMAVNQQARWIPSLVPVKGWIEEGYIGKPYFCLVSERFRVQFPAGTWKTEMDPFIIIQNGVHYLDMLRGWFGEPKLVYAVTTRDETNPTMGEHISVITLEYDNALRVCFINDWCNRCDKGNRTVCIEGTGGGISGDIDAGSVTLHSDKLSEGEVKEFKTDRKWFPDAFSGPMLDLMEAIREGREPKTSGRDNLKTLQVIFAAYKSVKEKRAVKPEEIQ